jgi:hypothetical protein
MLTVRGTRLKHANALFLSPTTNSTAKRCASSLHWRLATELILNFQHTDANTHLAPGNMISVNPAAICFLQEPKSFKTRVLRYEFQPESSDPSQSSPSTKTVSQGPSLTSFNLPQYASPSSSSPPTPESLSPPAAPYTCATQPHVPDTAKYQHPTTQMVKLFGHNPPFSPVIILFFACSLQAPD